MASSEAAASSRKAWIGRDLLAAAIVDHGSCEG